MVFDSEIHFLLISLFCARKGSWPFCMWQKKHGFLRDLILPKEPQFLTFSLQMTHHCLNEQICCRWQSSRKYFPFMRTALAKPSISINQTYFWAKEPRTPCIRIFVLTFGSEKVGEVLNIWISPSWKEDQRRRSSAISKIEYGRNETVGKRKPYLRLQRGVSQISCVGHSNICNVYLSSSILYHMSYYGAYLQFLVGRWW